MGVISIWLVQSTHKIPVKKGKIEQRKILSQVALAIIDEALKSGLHDGKDNVLEPPYMAPSTDAALYSSVRILATWYYTMWLTLHSGAPFAMTLVAFLCSAVDVELRSVSRPGTQCMDASSDIG